MVWIDCSWDLTPTAILHERISVGYFRLWLFIALQLLIILMTRGLFRSTLFIPPRSLLQVHIFSIYCTNKCVIQQTAVAFLLITSEGTDNNISKKIYESINLPIYEFIKKKKKKTYGRHSYKALNSNNSFNWRVDPGISIHSCVCARFRPKLKMKP